MSYFNIIIVCWEENEIKVFLELVYKDRYEWKVNSLVKFFKLRYIYKYVNY